MRSGEDSELAELLRQSGRGSEEAFAEFYDRTRNRVYTVVASILRAPDHAAEVVQELYVTVWREPRGYDWSRGTVTAWLMIMARHRAIDRVRSVERDYIRDSRYAESAARTGADHGWESVESMFRASWVRGELASLRPGPRQALLLAYFGGFTHVQIAGQLNLPLGTVKTRIREGIKALRRTMATSP